MSRPTLFGSEFLVNTSAVGNQKDSAAAGLSNGKTIVVWNDLGIRVGMQMYNADGSPFGPQLQANVSVLPGVAAPAVTALADGRFVVAWTNLSSVFPGDGSGTSIFGRMFNADGTPDGNEFFINTTTAGSQADVALAALADGGFVATWSHGASATNDDIRSRAFNADGTPRGSDGNIDADGVSETFPAAVGLVDGGHVLVWQDSGSAGETDGSGSHIRAKVTLANGVVLADFAVNSTTGGSQFLPTVAALADGGFAVAWVSDASGGGTDIRARLFFANGAPRGNDFAVDSTPGTFEGAPSMVGLPNGDLFVAWHDSGSAGETDGSLSHIRGKVISGSQSAPADSFVINTTAAGHQTYPSVTALADGRVLVSWTDNSHTGADTDDTAIRAQIIDPRWHQVSLIGGVTADDWVGTGFSDVMNGNAGDDRIDGAAGNDALNGGTGADAISGGDGDDIITGGSGDDTVTGGRGNDAMSGGTGSDTFFVSAGEGVDTITDFAVGPLSRDVIDLAGVAGIHTFAHLLARATQVGADTVIKLGGGNSLTLKNVARSVLAEGDFAFSPQPPPQGNDFNGDATSDVLWRNDDGTVVAWHLNGSGAIAATLTMGAPESAWRIAETGDFNGDGTTDLLWRHDDGTVVSWLLNEAGTITATQTFGTLDNTWHIAETGDFNADGRSDILWRNSASGETVAWLMDGGGVIGSLAYGAPEAAWQVQNDPTFLV